MKKIRVLLADDDELVIESMSAALELRGYEVVQAHDGKQAFEIIGQNQSWGFIILDLVMPFMDGQELLDHIKKKNPKAKVLIISAAGKYRDYTFIDKYNDVEFLPKPFSTPKLFSIIEKF